MKIRTIIVDDELPICSEIEYLLKFHADIDVLAKFDQSQMALDYITKNKCELVFLDIEMPGMTGLELAECIGTMDAKPLIVFVTAYEEYAVPAFATPAVGYITKPVTQVKLTKVLCKVRDLLPGVRKESSNDQKVSRVTVFKDGRLCPLSKQEIIMAYVKDKDVFVRTAAGEFTVQMNLQELAAVLCDAPFLRVHRQYIINLDFVEEVIPWFHGSYMVHMKGLKDTEIPISRAHIQELKKLLGFR
ncbi:MAG: LytTR family DNA-binding domain-containing protein [Acidaminococcaceae bacterium]|nr:LytTR family DNA-binding domain-containing protein [Acidaminococcaceae bacterium]